MLQAQLCGKLRYRQENLEDLLTSSVFGTLKYLAPEEGLCAVLAHARAGETTALHEVLADRPFRQIDYVFWPWLQEGHLKGCEPDVLITIRTRSARLARILVEAKYRSGKSSEALAEAEPTAPPNDQLAREWSNLVRLCRGDDATPILVYLTADPSPPRSELEASQAELARGEHPERATLVWLSWRDCAPALSPLPGAMMADLCAMLRERYGFTRFNGFVPPQRSTCGWTFAAPAATYDWSAARVRCAWRLA
jgi:hypothetical protein